MGITKMVLDRLEIGSKALTFELSMVKTRDFDPSVFFFTWRWIKARCITAYLDRPSENEHWP